MSKLLPAPSPLKFLTHCLFWNLPIIGYVTFGKSFTFPDHIFFYHVNEEVFLDDIQNLSMLYISVIRQYNFLKIYYGMLLKKLGNKK